MSQADFDKAGEDAKHPKTKSADNAMTFPYSHYKQTTADDTNSVAWAVGSQRQGQVGCLESTVQNMALTEYS
uniref:Uncharacterized protein n=1 Tax=Panthera leo TaxID=9689 RepID=A0A8C9D6B4_PANLE